MEEQLYHISMDYATYGAVVNDGIVTLAPPIAKWMIGEKWIVCKAWLDRKKAKIIPCFKS